MSQTMVEAHGQLQTLLKDGVPYEQLPGSEQRVDATEEEIKTATLAKVAELTERVRNTLKNGKGV